MPPPSPPSSPSIDIPYDYEDGYSIQEGLQSDNRELAECFFDAAGRDSPTLRMLPKELDKKEDEVTDEDRIHEIQYQLQVKQNDPRFKVLKLVHRPSSSEKIHGLVVYGYMDGGYADIGLEEIGYEDVKNRFEPGNPRPKHWGKRFARHQQVYLDANALKFTNVQRSGQPVSANT